MKIMKRIEAACAKTDRNPAEILLLAVTKTRSIEEINLALKAGISIIGENKVQEAEAKIPYLQENYKQFHFIGHLQSNKVKKLMQLKPDLIHSIDSFSTLKKINQLAIENGITVNVLIQVNTSGEESKFGIQPDITESFILRAKTLANIRILGLMTIGMFTSDQAKIRKCFRKLHEIFLNMKKLKQANCEMKFLSMGMSGDYEIAIEEGANILRIGSALFGPRVN